MYVFADTLTLYHNNVQCRALATHKLKHPVRIPRGYVGLYPCMLPYTRIPESIDIPRMRTESIMEKTLMACWLDSVVRLW